MCKAGQDLVLQSPVDWVILDGRESSDDRGIVQYEWTLLQGDSSLEMKVHMELHTEPVICSLLYSA